MTVAAMHLDFRLRKAEQDGDPNTEGGGVGFVFMLFFRPQCGIPQRSAAD